MCSMLAQLFGGLPPSLSATDAHELRVPAAGVDNAAMIQETA